MPSMALPKFFLVEANSSSFWAILLSISCFTLTEGSLKLHLLSLQPLPDFVNLMDGAASLADLVHDVLDLVGEQLVLPANFLELDD